MSDVDDPAPDQQPPPARLIAATDGAEEPRAVGPRGQSAGDAMTTAARLYALVALAGARARLACLEQAQQEPRATQERRRDGPNRRRADRRIQQDRERFEDAVMAQYVPPRPAAVPRATDQEEEHTDATPAPPSPGLATVDDN